MRISLAVLCAVCLFASTAAAQTYSILDLGALKGDNESSGFYLNNYGDVVGCSDKQTSEGYPCTGLVSGQRAFFWSKATGMKDLGTLPDATVSGAIGINDAGDVVGYSNVNGQASTNFVAVQWSPTHSIARLGSLSSDVSSAAFAANSAGEVAGDSFLPSGLVDATSWTSMKIRTIGSLPHAIFTAGLAINDNGQIVGESVFTYGPPFKSHAFVWNGSTMKDLGTLSGGTTSIANGINVNGAVAGQSNGTNTGGLWHAVLWNSSGKIKDLGTLVGGTYSVAFAVNDSSVVVGYGNTRDNAAHAIVWTASGGMRDLNNYIPSGTNWILINANAINKAGQITGYGSRNGYNHAFLLTPVE